MTKQELQDKREKVLHDAGELVGAENSFASTENRATFDQLMGEAAALQTQIADAERVEQLEAEQRAVLPESQGTGAAGDAPGEAEGREVYEAALGSYLRGQRVDEMAPEQRSALFSSRVNFSGAEGRDMSTLSGAAGGFVVPPDTRFYGRIVSALKAFGGMERAGAEVISTNTGGELPIPTSDDTGNVGAIIAEEGSHASGTEPTLSQKVLRAYLYSSKTMKVSWQFLQDGAIDVESWLGAKLGERLARIQNTHFTTGDGTNKPEGVMFASTEGRQAATGNTTTIPFDDVYRLIHSVDEAYRNANAAFMMADTTVQALRLAKDGNGRYQWPELGSVQAGQPARLAGYPVVVNNDVAAMEASAKAVSFGDHAAYKIRRVRGITIVRLNELFVENGQVGFLAFLRADGGLVDAGQGPVKHFANSAT